MPVTVSTAHLAAEIDGTPVPYTAEGLFDLDLERAVSQGDFTASVEPAAWSQNDPATLAMGAGTNNVTRLTGRLWEPDWRAPQRFHAAIRGNLARLETFRMKEPKGLLPESLTGTATPTLGQMVMGLLDYVGLAYDAANISDDPTLQLGTVDPSPLRWQRNHTAQQYLAEIQKVSVGRRLFESVGGTLYFHQVIGRPRGVADFTFTQGIDIFGDWSTKRTIRKAANSVSISGYERTAEEGRLTHTGTISLEPVISDDEEHSFELASDWMQTQAHLELMWDFWAQELARELVEVDLTTYRDELLGPGQTISVLLPNGAVTEPCWLRGVSGYVKGGAFRQHLRLQGGGLPAEYDPLPWL